MSPEERVSGLAAEILDRIRREVAEEAEAKASARKRSASATRRSKSRAGFEASHDDSVIEDQR